MLDVLASSKKRSTIERSREAEPSASAATLVPPLDNKRRYGWIPVLLVWLVCLSWIAVKLPTQPIPTGDSNAYLTLASYRPPVYGWVLHLYSWLTGGLTYLPCLQLLLFASGLLVFAIELGRLLESRIAAAAAVVLIAMHVGMREAPSWLMSESVFECLILTGLGFQFRAVRRASAMAAAGAVACFALAAGTRTSGAAFLLVPVLAMWLDRRRPLGAAAVRAFQIALVAGAVLAAVMTGNWAKSGRFEIGSWTGISLLGKGLLLLEPSDVAGLPPPVATVAPVANGLRGLIEKQPDLAARLRAQDQAYQDLRFPLFYPLAEQSWPAWAEGDWQIRGELALGLSRTVIARHPWKYVKLWANDWLSLVLYPQHWPKWATAQADGSSFPACRLHDNCWVLTRNDVPARTLADLLSVSFAGTIGGLVVLVFCARRVLRRRAEPVTALLWSMALILQISLLGTSAFEAGLVRYTDAVHVLGAALLLWFASMLPVRIALPRWTSARARWPAFLSRSEILFSGLYFAGVFSGLAIFWLLFSLGVLSSIPILFYRGLSLVAVVMIVQAGALALVLWGIRRSGLGSPIGAAHVLPIVLISTALNAAFFVLVPVNLDRSMSVFLLAWMDEHRDRPQTREDLTRALVGIYIDEFGAIDRRVGEQLASGDIVPRGDGYALTERGAQFVVLARQIGSLFSTDQRFLHPMAALPSAERDRALSAQLDQALASTTAQRADSCSVNGNHFVQGMPN